MSVGAARRWLTALFFVVVPYPLLGPFEAFAPALRYAVLAGATALVALAEGAAGPVGGILALFTLHSIAGLGVAWLTAWALCRGSAGLSPEVRRWSVLVLAALLLFGAVAFELYATPFGQAPRANLLGVLS